MQAALFKVNKATENLRNGKIDARAFLNSVVFSSKHTCKDFECVDHVGENPEENIVEEFGLDNVFDEDIAVRAASMQTRAADIYCMICLIARKTVLFTLCKHMNSCDECHKEYVEDKRKAFEASLNLYEDFDEPPEFLFSCMICRKMTAEKDVITNIFV